MKEMIKRIREEKGGFTLAELLIVVAIILVLVAVAVPVFTGAMDKANIAVGEAGARAVKAEAVTSYALDETRTNMTAEQKYEASIDKHGNVTGLKAVNDFSSGTIEVTPTSDDGVYKSIGTSAQSDTGVTVGVTVKGEDLSTKKTN